MALIDPCAFLGVAGNAYPAARLRRVQQLILASREGCLDAGGLVVSQTGTPSLSVAISGGAAVVAGDDVARQGAYVCESTAAVSVGPISTPHATLPRIDRVILEVLDQEGTGSGGGGRASDLPQFRIVAGTPSSSPSAPALPATAITLALVAVAAGATSIVNASITDLRAPLNPLSGEVGEVGFCATPNPPWGALLAFGGTFDSARYPALANALGSTTLPDLRGRAPIGSGQGPGLSARSLGEVGGAEAHVLSIVEMPSHQHKGTMTTGSGTTTGPTQGVPPHNGTEAAGQPWQSSLEGGGGPHNNMPPYVSLTPFVWT